MLSVAPTSLSQPVEPSAPSGATSRPARGILLALLLSLPVWLALAWLISRFL